MIYVNKNNGLCYEADVFEEVETLYLDGAMANINLYCVSGDEIVSIFTKTTGKTYPLVQLKSEL